MPPKIDRDFLDDVNRIGGSCYGKMIKDYPTTFTLLPKFSGLLKDALTALEGERVEFKETLDRYISEYVPPGEDELRHAVVEHVSTCITTSIVLNLADYFGIDAGDIVSASWARVKTSGSAEELRQAQRTGMAQKIGAEFWLLTSDLLTLASLPRSVVEDLIATENRFCQTICDAANEQQTAIPELQPGDIAHMFLHLGATMMGAEYARRELLDGPLQKEQDGKPSHPPGCEGCSECTPDNPKS
jgi:hypothetical protein